MLRIPHIYDLDPVDYRALEGDNRDLYGWMPESTLTLREEGTESIPGS